ncbi:hypothetical protein BX600DRAFT_474645 [Xylariales sp. PMI_506]|nr:hypothetical protein BX600DRAFT_474645 [Xylariales sp. PMI_506]
MSQMTSSPGDPVKDMFYENHPLYIEQRLHLEPTFEGKLDQIERQFHQFHKEREQGPVETRAKSWDKDVLHSNEQVELISNWASFDVLQYPDKPARAGMSMVHLLAIPKSLIVNGVYLTAKTAHIIDDMIHLFEEAWERPDMRDQVLRHQKEAIDRRYEASRGEPFAEQAHTAALAHYRELERTIGGLGADSFHYGLHLRPDNSADYLHLHIIAAPYEFRRYSTTDHDKKTKDAKEVRDFILRDPGSAELNHAP